jgi:hypothetical protein
MLRRLLLLWPCFVATLAYAHGPFDLTSRMIVHPDRIEITSTVGLDAARILLARAGLSPEQVSNTLQALGPDTSLDQPLKLADQLFRLQHAGKPLAASRIMSQSEGMELVLILFYPRPQEGTIEIHADAYLHVAELKPGSFMALAEPRASLGGTLLSKENQKLTLSLPLPAVSNSR